MTKTRERCASVQVPYSGATAGSSSSAFAACRLAVLGCALAWLPSPTATATESVAPDFSRAAKILSQAVERKVFPGCAVAVGTSGEVLWQRGFGRLDYTDGGEVDAHTLYDLASLTKVVGTTSTLVTLVRDGKLSVTDPVEKLLPEFIERSPSDADRQRRHKVTVEHLLTHSAGLPAWKPLYKDVKNYQELLAAVLATPLENEPGTQESYSDLGAILLGEITARAGGKPLVELERERVFDPLAMRQTLRNPPESRRKQIAPTERRAEADGFWQGVVHDENARAGGGTTGHAGLFSTAAELSIWAGEWLKATKGESRLFPRELAEQFTRRRELVKGSSRALGWDTPSAGSTAGKLFSARSFGHTGFTGTSLWIDPERDLYVILLTNAVHPARGKGGIQQVRRELADAVVEAVTAK